MKNAKKETFNKKINKKIEEKKFIFPYDGHNQVAY
jgi:hypothetical protein